MSVDIRSHPLLEAWTDPRSGVVSYILKTDVAACRQSFYFTNLGMTDDGRYLWFYTFNPPSGSAESGRTLAVADLHEGVVRALPETQFRDASPYIDPETGDAYWAWDYSVWKRPAAADADVELVNAVPEEIHRHRYGKRLATHLTRSADGTAFLIDAAFGREWIVGLLPIDGGDFEVLQSFDRCYNHAQMSPTDPDLALIAQDWWFDVATGEPGHYENRIWLLRRGESATPVFDADYGKKLTHEWWDASGDSIWYIDYTAGTAKVDIATSQYKLVWPNEADPRSAKACHCHADATGRYLVADQGTYQWKDGLCRVRFRNLDTGKEVDIASHPPVPVGDTYGKYHVHPHPQFCARDRFICYTTTVWGGIDVAVTHVADLIDRTS